MISNVADLSPRADADSMIFLAKTCCPLPEQRLRIPARRAMVGGVTSNSNKMLDKVL
jgi:hypothetical protein